MATTALGGVVHIGHRGPHDGSKVLLEEEADLKGTLEAAGEGLGQQRPHCKGPSVLMRAIKTEACPASPDSTISSSSSSIGTSEDSHVSVLRRGPSAAGPLPFVPFTAAPPRVAAAPGGLRVHHHHQPASVARRNARERNRVKQVNNGFATLRQHIPPALIAAAAAERASSPSERQPSGRCGNSGSAAAAAKKMSKVETLRCAVEYIRSLQDLLEEADGGSEPPSGAEVSPSPPPGAVHCSPASSSPESSPLLPLSPAAQEGTRQYLPLQPVQPFDYVDVDSYSRLQDYVASDGAVLQFYHHERIKREEGEEGMVMEPHHGVVAATGSPPPHGYSTSATAYLAMAPGPALVHRGQQGEDVDLVDGDVAGMMTWWTEGPQC